MSIRRSLSLLVLLLVPVFAVHAADDDAAQRRRIESERADIIARARAADPCLLLLDDTFLRRLIPARFVRRFDQQSATDPLPSAASKTDPAIELYVINLGTFFADSDTARETERHERTCALRGRA